MIITVAHLSGRECEHVGILQAAAMASPSPSQTARRVLVIRTDDDARSGDQICHEAIARNHAACATAVMPTARAMHTMLPRLTGHYDDIVIEVQGVDSALVRTALGLCERVVVPVVVGDEVDASGDRDTEDALREFMMTTAIARHHNESLSALVRIDGCAPAWLADLVSAHDGWTMQSQMATAAVVMPSAS